MEEKKTVHYKRTMRGTMGAGVSALFNGDGRRFYILEHRDASKYHKAGEAQKIIIDQIELGRHPDCQVRFDDETWDIVSRRHAAIVRVGDRWKLVQLSKTNSTLLNGQQIKTEWYLQNGDEIQLSVGGPRLGFIVPEGKQGLVSSIKLTQRIKLASEQALKPYRRAIAVLSILLVLAIGGLCSWNYNLQRELVEKGKLLAEQYKLIGESKEKADSLEKEISENNKLIAGYEERLSKLRNISYSTAGKVKEIIEGKTIDEKLKACYPYVYYVEVTFNNIITKNGPLKSYGSAFLLDDGRLVTAHHMVDFWSNIAMKRLFLTDSIVIDQDATETKLNIIAHNQEPIDVTWDAYSSTKDHIQYHYTSDNIPFKMGNSQTRRILISDEEEEGISWALEVKSYNDRTDWAYIQTNRKGGLKASNDKSITLGAKTRLDVLGFPNSRGAEDKSKITPIYSESTVARDELDVNGTIMLSNEDTQGGNSGGPVFIRNSNEYWVIGILSGATGGKDRVVPINEIH